MRIAITGGIGEGKSTVLRMIAELGGTVDSADLIARDLFATDEIQDSLREFFGDQASDPAWLRAKIAASPTARRLVNRILHRPIVEAMAISTAQYIEVPLLVEAGLVGAFDRVWVVTCGPEEQRRRLLARYDDPGQVDGLLATQLPTRTKITFADEIIRTNCDLDSVFAHVSQLVRV
jgi:dephospho-CoA kinase